MKYCTNCHTHKQSWAEHYRNYSSYSDCQCWSCDKWTLSDCHGHCNHHLYSENSRLQSALSDARSEAYSARSQASVYSGQLTTTQSQLTTTQSKLEKKENELDELNKALNELEIKSNNKDNEIKGKNKEIERKERDIETLKLEVGKSQEEVFDYKLKEQRKELDIFVQELGINRQKVRELLKVYQQLIMARENYNRDNIIEAEDIIEKIRDELLESGENDLLESVLSWTGLKKRIVLENVNTLCSKCEKLAHLKTEQRKIQEQRFKQQQQQQRLLEARQEQTVPPHQ